MTQFKKNKPRQEAKTVSIKNVKPVFSPSERNYRFKKPSYVSRYREAISYLQDLEESEIEIMIASSHKIASTN